jgi:hypothetical protein
MIWDSLSRNHTFEVGHGLKAVRKHTQKAVQGLETASPKSAEERAEVCQIRIERGQDKVRRGQEVAMDNENIDP